MSQDQIYSLPLNRVGDFEFDDAVADVFPDMIRRSVPGYSSMLSMIGQCASRYAKAGTHIYDLGCSLGGSTLIAQQNAPADCSILAIDQSKAMVSRFRESLQHQPNVTNIQIIEDDIRNVLIQNASFVILNLTLQFLPVEDRETVLQTVFEGLIPGGALLLSEKICFEHPEQQSLLTELHHDFKRAHGYSDLEIAQKRTAIENRLLPDSLPQHIQRLQGCGFDTVVPWFQCFTFASMIAIKN